jgi:hypothetical protein
VPRPFSRKNRILAREPDDGDDICDGGVLLFLDLSQSDQYRDRGDPGKAPPNTPSAVARRPRDLRGPPVAAATIGVALAWYGPGLLARLNRWHFSWRMPLLLVFRDLVLPVIYIDAWITDEFVWRGNEMTMREEEPGVEQG